MDQHVETTAHPSKLQEITRRVNLCNIWQAAYTAGVVIPKPVAACQYWHRYVNAVKNAVNAVNNTVNAVKNTVDAVKNTVDVVKT